MKKLIDQIKLHEGVRFRPYRCTAGKLTIGVGRNLDDKPLKTEEVITLFGSQKTQAEITALLNKGLSMKQVDQLLAWDIQDAIDDAKAVLPIFQSLSEQRQYVIVDMAFNMGRRTLSSFRNTLRFISEGNYARASENMLQSKWATQVKGRAKRLSIMMKDNLYHDQVTTEMLRKLG
jgi:lysozyme